MALTPLQRHQARSMGMNVDWAEDLLSFIGVRPDLATFPMEYYTPEGASLSDANFAETLRTAAAAAQENGGIVQIPAGSWNVDDEFEFPSAGRNKPLYIEGSGVNLTTILVPVGYEGVLFHLTGMPLDGAADLYYDGGLANFSISCAAEDVSTTGVGIKLSACIGAQFLNLIIRNLSGGTGFWSSYDSLLPDFTNQYIQLWNTTVASCDINYNLDAFINCQGSSVFSNSGVTNDFLIPNAKVAFYGGNIQTSAPVAVNFEGRGGSQVVFHDFYHEGFAGTLFKLRADLGSNQVSIYNFHCGGAPTVFADVGFANDLTVFSANGVTNSGTVLKARDAANCLFIECSDPVALPGKFDLDASSAANLICVSNGAITASQTKYLPRAAAGVTGPSQFVDLADGALKFKGAGGTITTLAPA